MYYHDVRPAVFLGRPNRFLARVELDGAALSVHIKNTGRLGELLIPGARVFLEKTKNPERKTPYDLIAVEKNGTLINIDSQAPNLAVGEWLRDGGLYPSPTLVQAEKKDGNSRLDFYLEAGTHKAYLEVKGCTLEENGTALFPDAPTLRGVKHIRHLAGLAASGYEAYLLIIIAMESVRCFRPNDRTHPEFGAALREAAKAGVRVLAFSCRVRPDSLFLADPVPVLLA